MLQACPQYSQGSVGCSLATGAACAAAPASAPAPVSVPRGFMSIFILNDAILMFRLFTGVACFLRVATGMYTASTREEIRNMRQERRTKHNTKIYAKQAWYEGRCEQRVSHLMLTSCEWIALAFCSAARKFCRSRSEPAFKFHLRKSSRIYGRKAPIRFRTYG